MPHRKKSRSAASLQHDEGHSLGRPEIIGLFLVLACMNLANFHGKQWSMFLIERKPPFLWEGAYNCLTYGLSLAGAATVIAAGVRIRTARLQLLALCVAAFVFPVGAQLVSDGRSVLIMMLQVYFSAAVGVVLFFRRSFEKPMPLEFWDRMVAMGTRAIRFGFIFYGALLALLKYISDEIKEGKDGFLSTALYPTITVLVTFFVWTLWLIVPAWERAVRLRSFGFITGEESDESDDLASDAQEATKQDS